MKSEFTITEENYIKAIYVLSYEIKSNNKLGTKDIATVLKVQPATVTDMLKKLKKKKIINYKKYGEIQLTNTGILYAKQLLRKHRLWETFLYEKLHFNWDEIHEIAEQLEHIQSDALIDRLEKFLQYPQYDPHGEPIPDASGKIPTLPNTVLSQIKNKKWYSVIAVKDTSPEFLKYLQQISIQIGTKLKLIEKIPFENSIKIAFSNNKQIIVSGKIADNILVTEMK
ncbi:MAG: metal-dependent regulator [Bacteroidia bacterium]|jgi:DtxR family Mn-dependent transcriptional regulator|nr:metal-dependent regulator [Bacteroidia bacterium]